MYEDNNGNGSFNQQPYEGYVQNPQPNGKKSYGALSIVSLVFGILGLVCCFCGYGVPIIFSIVALVTGIIGRKKEKNGLNLAGIICGSVGIAFNIIWLVLMILGFASMDMTSYL